MTADDDMDDAKPLHPEIVERLPDYALGALPEPELDLVARHLEGCAECRAELRRVLAVGAALADVPPPSAASRDALLARATGRVVAPVPTRVDPPLGRAPRSIGDRPAERPRPGSRAPLWVALAAALALAVGLGAWNVRLQRGDADGDVVAAVVAGAAVAHPLTDSELVPPASGVLFADPESERALLVARDLPPLPSDRRYQVWLFTDAGERIGAGPIEVEADGRTTAPIEAPAPFAGYVAVALSAEPRAGSPAPTSPLALGGWLDA